MKLSGKILVKYFVFSDVNFPNFKNHLNLSQPVNKLRFLCIYLETFFMEFC